MAITSIDLKTDGTTVHVTVQDQDNKAVDPSFLTWAMIPGITIAPDDTGFMFFADSSVSPGDHVTSATYNGPRSPNLVVGPGLTLHVAAAVVPLTALQYVSP